mmetsp:Transcript_22528/g.40468  ORF Transcript_22528/g.40468 Transcript_22528/m.40468 type:complete len:362 (-) Transcript_22528:8-1093(-)
MARLGTLRKLNFNHLHGRVGGTVLELRSIKGSILCTATKVTSTNVPHDIATRLEVEAADTTFTSVVVKVTVLGSFVQGKDSIITESTITHTGHVETRCRVRLLAVVVTNRDTLVLLGDFSGPDRLVHPLVTLEVDIATSSKGLGIRHTLGTLVYNATLLTAKRLAFVVILNKVLADLRAYGLKQVAHVTEHREVASNGVAGLSHIANSDGPVSCHETCNGKGAKRCTPCHAQDSGTNNKTNAGFLEEITRPVFDKIRETCGGFAKFLLPAREHPPGLATAIKVLLVGLLGRRGHESPRPRHNEVHSHGPCSHMGRGRDTDAGGRQKQRARLSRSAAAQSRHHRHLFRIAESSTCLDTGLMT